MSRIPRPMVITDSEGYRWLSPSAARAVGRWLLIVSLGVLATQVWIRWGLGVVYAAPFTWAYVFTIVLPVVLVLHGLTLRFGPGYNRPVLGPPGSGSHPLSNAARNRAGSETLAPSRPAVQTR